VLFAAVLIISQWCFEIHCEKLIW